METGDTAENFGDRVLTAEQRLLAEGIPSYIDAMMAIQELQQTIQKRCKRVLCEGREEFEKAIGMTLDATKIEDYSFTDTGGCVYLGVQIPLLMGAQRAGIAFVALTVSKEDDQSPVIQVFVAIQLKDRGLFDRMYDIAKREESLEVVGRWMTIQLFKEVPSDRIPSFEDNLSDLMGEWSRLWQRVGVPVWSV